uniref:PDZ domain-containing protein n=1 Tax=Bionectria ochroleuca TaxID=29856 RepID=A0A8H7KB80_BIOOC
MTQLPLHHALDQADLAVTITPGLLHETVTHLIVQVVLKKPALGPGDILVQLPLELAKIPTARYDGNTLKAFDQSGPLELERSDDPEGPPIIWRKWITTRPTHGDVTILATPLPRVVGVDTKTGPAFDLRADNNGIIGTGYAFLPLPADGESKLTISVDFHLRYSPAGFHGVFTHSPPDLSTARLTGRPSILHQSFYLLGRLKYLKDYGNNHDAVTSSESGHFNIFWQSELPFDIQKVAKETKQVFEYMCDFFQCSGESYRIFSKEDPYYVVRSGLAQPGAFLISFGLLLKQAGWALDSFTTLFAHEMTHNFANLAEGEDIANGAQWYAEGLAEYYSIFARYRLGLLDKHGVINEMNYRAQAYYTSPLATLSNEEVNKLTWKTQNAQRLPYSRGLVFWIRLDALIRETSGGHRGIDKLVVEMVQLARTRGKLPTLAEFLERLAQDLGPVARQEYEHHNSGKLIVPPEHSLIPGAVAVRIDMEPFDLGFNEESVLQGPRIVRGLRSDSRAAKAGILEGDLITSWIDLNHCKDHLEVKMELKIERKTADSEVPRELDITFWPRAYTKVEGWGWKLVNAKD